jgi:hypothetical protein
MCCTAEDLFCVQSHGNIGAAGGAIDDPASWMQGMLELSHLSPHLDRGLG